MNTKLLVSSLLASACLAVTATAQIFSVHGSTAAPASTLGGYTMTAFPNDPNTGNVTSVASPLGGSVLFSSPVDVRAIGAGWMTWSHGYTGTVYYSNGATSLTLTLPTATAAFYFYTEPNPFNDVQFTIASGTELFSETINGSGAAEYIGFYGLNGSTIDSITITGEADFAVGEFGIAMGGAVPEPSTYGMIGAAALLGLAAFRRFRRK